MDIRALVLINSTGCTGENRVAFAGPPLALLDVAGKSPFQRMLEQIKLAGISPITAVIQATPLSRPDLAALPKKVDYRIVATEDFWQVSGSVFQDLTQRGAELVLIVRLGPYAEVDFEQLLQFHLKRSSFASQVVHDKCMPDVFLVSASRRNAAAASLFCGGDGSYRNECPSFAHAGYINPLRDAHDLRDFAVDILSLKTKSKPAGYQLRPGVWIAPKAAVEQGAHILTPAFIGRSARIRSGAVITRCTAIEHHARVGSGTIVENSTVLPYTRIASGLDLSHSVAGLGQIANLRLGTIVKVQERFIGYRSSALWQKLLAQARQTSALLFHRIQRGVIRAGRAQQPKLKSSVARTSTAPAAPPVSTAASSESLSDPGSSGA
jgi:hypothetical protein